jgi:signal peptidase II
MNAVRKLVLVALVAGTCVGCDHATKALAELHLAGEEPTFLVGDTVCLSYVENAGAFLGLGGDLPERLRFWLFEVAVGLGLLWLLGWSVLDRELGVLRVVAIALVIGGGAGNLIDRVSLGVVRDFLQLGLGDLRTGVFNLADVAVTAGAVALVLAPRKTTPRRASG